MVSIFVMCKIACTNMCNIISILTLNLNLLQHPVLGLELHNLCSYFVHKGFSAGPLSLGAVISSVRRSDPVPQVDLFELLPRRSLCRYRARGTGAGLTLLLTFGHFSPLLALGYTSSTVVLATCEIYELELMHYIVIQTSSIYKCSEHNY